MMDLFSETDFEVSHNLNIEVMSFRGHPVCFVDNFYKYPYRVRDYIDSCPIKSHKIASKKTLNGRAYLDGRLHVNYPNSYTDVNRVTLYERICGIYGVEFNPINWMRTYNLFRLIKKPKEKYWWPHQDPALNFLVYLNPMNDMGPGTSFFTKTNNREIGDEHVESWLSEDDFIEDLCVLDKFNTLVVFPGQFYHSQRIVGNTFRESTRVTEILFSQ